jgi:hypothetical protein
MKLHVFLNSAIDGSGQFDAPSTAPSVNSEEELGFILEPV